VSRTSRSRFPSSHLHVPSLLALAAIAGVTLWRTEAHACGVSGVGGQASAACALELPDQKRVSAAYTYTNPALSFTGDQRADVTRHAVSASMAFPWGKRLVVEGAVGGLAGGTLTLNHVDYNFRPGFLIGASATYLFVREGKWMPSILASATLAGLFASTSSKSDATQDFDAFDLRIGGAAGKHITEAWSVFALARAFGGPVYWRVAQADGSHASVTGTDRYHYQVGLGTAYSLGPAHLFAEGIPLGEQALTVGAGSAF
jgi:hypothetical protein